MCNNLNIKDILLNPNLDLKEKERKLEEIFKQKDKNIYNDLKIKDILLDSNLNLKEKEHKLEEMLNFKNIFKEFKNYKTYNESNIKDILLNPNLDLKEKQIEFENTSIFNYTKIYTNDQNCIKKILILRNRLLSINFLTVEGKTIIKKLLEKINKETLIDLILTRRLLMLKFIKCYSADFIKNVFLSDFKHYAKSNNLQIRYPYIDPDKFKKNYLNYEVVERAFAYIVEAIKENNIIKFDFDEKIFKLFNLDEISTKESIIILEDKWPLLIPAKTYEYIDGDYFGAYYTTNKKLNLSIKNSKIKNDIEITEKTLNNINKLQSFKYYLVTNLKIVEAIENIEKYFTDYFLSFKQNKKYIEDWYACYQYLTFVKNNIKNIYYPYTLDFRGRIYNGITFGLNPTSNKLSRVLIGFGKIYLNETSILNLKKYICASFNINLMDFDSLMDINLDFINDVNIEYLLDKYSLKNLILLLDWKENVLKNNYTEMTIELDASQSGFQILSLLSNDYKAMLHTNLIKSDNNFDLYTVILDELFNKLKSENPKWCNVINRSFIKKIIMTIPYGSKYFGKIDMLVDEFKSQYSLKRLCKNNYIPLILDNNIVIDSDELIERLKDLHQRVQDNNYDISKHIDPLESKLIENLKFYFFKKIIFLVNEITLELYPNILNFTQSLKNLYLKDIKIPYYTFCLEYYKEYEKSMEIKNTIYTKRYIDFSKIDKKKIITATIANICQGMGDAFVMHTLIEKLDISIYPIHDAVLCNVNDIELIQSTILEVYKEVYLYYYNYSDFNPLRNSKEDLYELDSLEIFKIK